MSKNKKSFQAVSVQILCTKMMSFTLSGAFRLLFRQAVEV